jgi:hypothetical protein
MAGTFGNAGRGQFRGPGMLNVDTSLFKRIPLKERLNLQFRTEIFNVLNHANFDTPNLIIFAGTDISPTQVSLPERLRMETAAKFSSRCGSSSDSARVSLRSVFRSVV